MSSIRSAVAALAAASLVLPATAAGAPALAVTALHCSPCWSGVALVSPAGTRLGVLTHGAGREDDDPAWSPDGARIAFTRRAGAGSSSAIFVMGADGRGARRLTRGRLDEQPAWSPDGRWIAYAAGTAGIRLVHPGGDGGRVVPGTRGASGPAWSPDGRRLAFGQEGAVLTARPDGSARRRLAAGRDPDYAPDGRTIAYTGRDGGVFVVGAAGGQRARFLHAGMQPAFSPDGRQLAFTRWSASGRFSVWVMDAAGGRARRVLGDARAPAWRP